MDFRWIGGNGYKDLDLVIYGILKPDDTLKKGEIISIPNEMISLIARMSINGNYVKVTQKKVKKHIKNEKTNKKEGED